MRRQARPAKKTALLKELFRGTQQSRQLDAAEVAQSAQDPGMAAEMYLASVLLVDDQQQAERTYLDELAYQLKLDPDLQAHLEQQDRGGAA